MTSQGRIHQRRICRSVAGVLGLAGGLLAALFVVLTPAAPLSAQSSVEIDMAPAEQSILPGTQASFTVTITNTSATTLTTISVTQSDDLWDCYRIPIHLPLPDLGPGAHTSYTCQSDNLGTDRSPQLAVTGILTPSGAQVTDSASAIVHVEHLRVLKMPELQSVALGATATFTVQVENTGGFTLTDISVSDALSPACSRSLGTLTDLGPYQAHAYSCASPTLVEDSWNQIEAAAVIIPGNVARTDRAEAVVLVDTPLAVSVSPEEDFAPLNSSAPLRVVVRNHGASALTGVEVSAPAAPDCDRAAGTLGSTLGPERSVSYVCQTQPLTQNTGLHVTAGAMRDSLALQADANCLVHTAPFAVSVLPASQFAVRDQVVTFTVTITNLHSTHDLADIVATAVVSDCSRSAGDLPTLTPGDHLSYTCHTEPMQFSIRNVVEVTAVEVGGQADADPIYTETIARAEAGIYILPLIFRSR
jgi:uncharacterized repeat protein (TIGR01451 family)